MVKLAMKEPESQILETKIIAMNNGAGLYFQKC